MGSMGSSSGQVAKMMLDAYNCWRVEPLLQHLDPKVEWRPALLVLLEGEATVYRGHDGVRRMFRDFREAFAEIQIESFEVRDLGDLVITTGHMRARGNASGVETETPWGYVAELKGGKGIRIRTYLDPADALEAAGLSE